MSNGLACSFLVCPHGLLYKTMALLVLVSPSPQGATAELHELI